MSDDPTTLLHIVCPACMALNRVPAAKLGAGPLCGKCRKALIAGEPVNADDSSFARFITKGDLPVVVDFWASWCGPCLQFAPVFSETAAVAAQRALFIKLDTESNPQTAGRYQIRSIPTLMIFHRGQEVARLSGALPPQQFQQWLDQHLPRVG